MLKGQGERENIYETRSLTVFWDSVWHPLEQVPGPSLLLLHRKQNTLFLLWLLETLIFLSAKAQLIWFHKTIVYIIYQFSPGSTWILEKLFIGSIWLWLADSYCILMTMSSSKRGGNFIYRSGLAVSCWNLSPLMSFCFLCVRLIKLGEKASRWEAKPVGHCGW